MGLHALERQALEVLGAGPRKVDGVVGLGYGIVGRTVLDCGLDAYGEQLLRIYALSASERLA